MKYAVLDFETTGLNPQVNALASVGIVVLDSDLEFGTIQEYYSVINEPDKIVDDKALEVNGLTIEQLREGKPVATVLEEIREVIKDCVIVNHNSAFDVEWLNFRGFEILESIDTMNLSWKKWPSLKAKLGIVCERFGIPVENAHNSLDDSRMTAEVFRQFVRKYPELEPLKPQPIKFRTFKKEPEIKKQFVEDGKRYIIISGSRNYSNYIEFDKIIVEILKEIKSELPDVKREDVEFIVGDARGVDKLGKLFAEKFNFPLKVFYASWHEFGDRAGMLRNQDMIDYALTHDIEKCRLIAFPSPDSIGTRGMIDIAKKAGIKTQIFNVSY